MFIVADWGSLSDIIVQLLSYLFSNELVYVLNSN